jgi:hypothetical protein
MSQKDEMKELRFCVYLLISGFLFSCSNEERTEEKTTSSIERLDVTIDDFGCTYSGDLDMNKIYLFQSNDDAEVAIDDIMKLTGLSNNFIVKAADVDNACALIKNNERYIFYNQHFMHNVLKKTNTKFGALSILAHEIGHHLNGHTFLNLKDDVRIQLELEADRFSGFVLAKNGATLEEALKAIQIYGSVRESSTHPSKKTRIAAITNGFKEGKNSGVEPAHETVSLLSDFKYVIQLAKPPLAMRNKSLSPEEIKLANSGTELSKKLNKETIIADLPNGTPVELLSQVNNTYYIRAYLSNKEITGYIVKKFQGVSTIKKKED